MKALFIKHPDDHPAVQAAWFLAWFCLPLSMKLSGASMILVTLIILVCFTRRPFLPDARKAWYLLPPVVFFAWHALELVTGRPFLPVWKETEKMLSFLVIPPLYALGRIRKETFTRMAMTGLVSALTICGIIMLAAAGIRFIQTGLWDEFTYHNFARPIHTGAIYFSFYLLFALFKLDDPAWLKDHTRLKVVTGLFLLGILLLCASKLLIGVGLPLLAWHYRRFLVQNFTNHRKVFVAVCLLIALGTIPFLKRAQLLIHPNLEMVRSTDFIDSPEPNGLNLRLIFWRFGIEVLNERHAWFTGVGMIHSQSLLNNKIIQSGLYTGTGKGTDTGYLNYNYHNQFIETMVKSGIPGLVILILILVIFAFQPQAALFAPKEFLWIITGLFFTESVLERQAGILFFCLVICAFFIRYTDVVNPNDR